MNLAADRVVVLGRNVQVQPVAGTPIEVWDIDEPSRRGIGGIERVRLIHADITDRVNELAQRLQPDPPAATGNTATYPSAERSQGDRISRGGREDAGGDAAGDVRYRGPTST